MDQVVFIDKSMCARTCVVFPPKRENAPPIGRTNLRVASALIYLNDSLVHESTQKRVFV